MIAPLVLILEKMMGKHTQPNIKIRNLLESSTLFYQDLLGYAPEKTALQQIPKNQWEVFTRQRGLNSNSSGIYLPRNQTAVIRGENPFSLFHEYFGHGLYCEQSQPGKKLVNLEKALLEEESQEFGDKKFTLEDLQKFRLQNQTFQELRELEKQELGQYELFAIWTEYLLSGEHNLREEFERKYDGLPRQDKEIIDSVINMSQSIGNLATMYHRGMARRTTPKRAKQLLKDIYKDKLTDVELALLYGSKKEFSDIDIFMIGKNPLEFNSEYLDAKMESGRDLKKGVKLFDVRTIVPLMTGEFILGNEEVLKQIREQLSNQPITKDAIKHNLKWHSRMLRLNEENEENPFLQKKFEGYAKTYLANALALKQGLRLFTKEDLVKFLEDNSLILKGGTVSNAT